MFAKRDPYSLEQATRAATILVVDDEDLIRTLICRMLQGAGHYILNAASANDAIAVCEGRNGAIHLMVTDVTMPGMSGLELVDYATERWPNIKILFISGFAADAAIRRGISKHPFLQKPFTRDQLMGKVQQILNHAVAGL